MAEMHMDRPSRRSFLKRTLAGGAAAAVGFSEQSGVAGEELPESLSFGLVTDVHYADENRAGSRYYRDSQEKLRTAIETFNRKRLSLVAELGDFVDAGPKKADDIKYLHAIREVYGEFHGRRHYVLGNHCVTRLTKKEFLSHCGTRIQRSYHSFDQGRFHFVVLDANFTKDGTPYAEGNFVWTDCWIHTPQQKWLAEDLQKARNKNTVVLIHQNLDREKDPHGVKNGPTIRRLLEKSGNVLAVFQGHMHTGGYSKIGGIHYVTLRAMVEGPGDENQSHAVVTIDGQDRIAVEGFGRQKTLSLE